MGFTTGLGGMGNPDDYNRVNSFSWDVDTQEFWTPDHNFVCAAEGDVCPICSIKRDPDLCIQLNLEAPSFYGSQIMARSSFIDFQMWITAHIGLPAGIDNSYDPIWYLFHSTESYYQALWINVHGYDAIASEDLNEYPAAFSPYCDTTSVEETTDECVGIDLNDELFISGLLPKRGWSYVHDNKLTIERLYSLPQWNVIYDVNGDKFFEDSGLKEHAVDLLNDEWFIGYDESAVEEGEIGLNAKEVGLIQFGGMGAMYQMLAMFGLVFVVCLLSLIAKERRGKKLLSEDGSLDHYGSVASECSVCSADDCL